MTDAPPDIPVKTARRSLWERASVVWIVPILALVIALGVAWQSYADRGPLIVVVFDESAGIRVGETELRYRDVAVGVVEDLGFSDGLETVQVSIRLDADIAPFVDEEARFWVVQPEVSAQGVTGLDTVLSGVFIEGVWDNEPGGIVYEHRGLTSAPLLLAGQTGLEIVLTAAEGASLSEGTPLLFKGIEVGRVGEPVLSPSGQAARAPAVIFSPYDDLITSATRFWDTSGFSFSIGTTGAELDFSSLASLIAGGVTFETIVSGGEPVSDGAIFELFPDESSARSSLFAEDRGPPLNLTVIFEENVSGLSTGAPVELGGVRIGEVTNLSGLVDPDRFGDDRVRLLATLALRPGRLGLGEGTDPGTALDFLATQVEEGLRARLATASLLTGGLKVELVSEEDVTPAELDLDADPFPILPSTESNVSDVTASAEGVLERINNLPIEELLQSAIGFLDAARALTADDELGQIPGDVRALLGDVRGVVASEEIQNLPGQVAGMIGQIETAATDLQTLTASFTEVETARRLQEALEAASEAADSVTTSVEGVPELVQSLTDVANTAEELPLEDLILSLTDLTAQAEALLASEATADLPENLNEALRELTAAVSELRAGGTVENLNATLASASDAAAAIEQAAEDLPDIADRLDAVLRQADTTLAGLDTNSDLSRAARAALREVEQAARAFESLARTLERQPNSLILGR